MRTKFRRAEKPVHDDAQWGGPSRNKGAVLHQQLRLGARWNGNLLSAGLAREGEPRLRHTQVPMSMQTFVRISVHKLDLVCI